LISCVKSGQGFDWNQGTQAPTPSLPRLANPSIQPDEIITNATPIAEIFLPSYADYHFDNDLETRRDPVTDIIVTDEEVGKMFPE
jgi:hypothetical protein